ncbi:hypothetical protein NHX12_027544, partial [Muraenolepis orangiensis]
MEARKSPVVLEGPLEVRRLPWTSSRTTRRARRIILPPALIKKTKTAILVPNAIVIATTSERHVFVSFLARDSTFKLLRSLSGHLEVGITGSSPITSSCENSFRVEAPSSLPLELCADFSVLDSVVRHRRPEDLLESSSSDFAGLPERFLKDGALSESFLKDGALSVHADIHLQSATQKHPLQNGNAVSDSSPGAE